MPDLIDQLKALGEENRFRIMMMLRERPLCVCELGAVLDIAGATLSNHLKVLRYAGLVDSRRDGKWIEYYIRDEETTAMMADLYERLDDRAQVDADRKQLGSITREICSVGSSLSRRSAAEADTQ